MAFPSVFMRLKRQKIKTAMLFSIFWRESIVAKQICFGRSLPLTKLLNSLAEIEKYSSVKTFDTRDVGLSGPG